MSQAMLDMINRMGGADAAAAMASKVGLSPEQAQSAIAALLPALTGGMAKQAGGGGLDQLAGMAAAFTGSAASEGAVSQGNEILGSVFGSKDVSRAVAAKAAAQTGLDVGALKALLPMVATMAASALGNGDGLGGMLGGLMGGGQKGGVGALLGMLDANKDGNPLDDIMGMLKR